MTDLTKRPTTVLYARDIADQLGIPMLTVQRIAPLVGATKDSTGLWVFTRTQRRSIRQMLAGRPS